MLAHLKSSFLAFFCVRTEKIQTILIRPILKFDALPIAPYLRSVSHILSASVNCHHKCYHCYHQSLWILIILIIIYVDLCKNIHIKSVIMLGHFTIVEECFVRKLGVWGKEVRGHQRACLIEQGAAMCQQPTAWSVQNKKVQLI